MGQPIEYPVDLKPGTKSVKLTLSTGAGSIPVTKDTGWIGVKPTSSTAIVVALDDTAAAVGTKTGTAAETDLTVGMPCDAAVWTWFYIGPSVNERTLKVVGGASDELTITRVPA